MTDHDILLALVAPVRAACDAILAVRAQGYAPRTKEDFSPVTEADEAAEHIITGALRQLTPDIPIVGEEAFAAGLAPATCGDVFWLIDPVDGTKEFIRGGDDYTVNVALVRQHSPVLGVIATPATGRLWMGGAALGAQICDTEGQWRPIQTRPAPARRTVVISHSHLDPHTQAYLKTLGAIETVAIGSSLKFCLLAEGLADLYPRFGPTSEWDTAAGHAILIGAGGSVITPEGAPFLYGKDNFKNGPFIATTEAFAQNRP